MIFEPALKKKCCLPPALNGRSKWASRALALLHYSIQAVLAPSPNPTWALGSAAQLSLFLALHCITTPSSLHSLPRLCTTPLHCSTTRNQHYQKPLFPALFPALSCVTARIPLPPSPLLQQLRSLLRLPPLRSRVQLFYCITAETLCHLPPALRGTARPRSSQPPLFFSALSIPYQAATPLKHPPAFSDHLLSSLVHTCGVTRLLPPTPMYPPSSALQPHSKVYPSLHHLSTAL